MSEENVGDWKPVEIKVAREVEPWAWSLDPPDISSAQARLTSLHRARRYIQAYRLAEESQATIVRSRMNEVPSDAVLKDGAWVCFDEIKSDES